MNKKEIVFAIKAGTVAVAWMSYAKRPTPIGLVQAVVATLALGV